MALFLFMMGFNNGFSKGEFFRAYPVDVPDFSSLHTCLLCGEWQGSIDELIEA